MVTSGRRLGTRSKSNTVARVAEHQYLASEEPLRLRFSGYRLTNALPIRVPVWTFRSSIA